MLKPLSEVPFHLNHFKIQVDGRVGGPNVVTVTVPCSLKEIFEPNIPLPACFSVFSKVSSKTNSRIPQIWFQEQKQAEMAPKIFWKQQSAAVTSKNIFWSNHTEKAFVDLSYY